MDSVYSEEDKEKVKDVRILLHLNMAACSLQLKEASATLKECEKVHLSICLSVCLFFFVCLVKGWETRRTPAGLTVFLPDWSSVLMN